MVNNKLFSHNVRWLIQVPRLYNIYKSSGIIKNFEDVIQSKWFILSLSFLYSLSLVLDLFEPLFEVTQDPSSHPELHVFLQRVIGFDSVDDESKPERRTFKKYPKPSEWDFKTNPPYSYYIYYTYANVAALNNWRVARGFSKSLSFSPLM